MIGEYGASCARIRHIADVADDHEVSIHMASERFIGQCVFNEMPKLRPETVTVVPVNGKFDGNMNDTTGESYENTNKDVAATAPSTTTIDKPWLSPCSGSQVNAVEEIHLVVWHNDAPIDAEMLRSKNPKFRPVSNGEWLVATSGSQSIRIADIVAVCGMFAG